MNEVHGRQGSSGAADEGNGYVEIDPTGRYGRFEELLGKGAMKKVYRAFDEAAGMEVAWNQAELCDVLQSPEKLQRLYSEVDLLSTLRHDSIIRFHASWVDAGRRSFNFITELFASGTLRGYRCRYRRVGARAVKSWARQILRGLVYLHGHDPPIIHRDLKCDNIFVNGHLGRVKIGDLGFAAVLRGSQSAHSIIGTPEFMAPELYEEEYNELVDTYSFGMCVLEMLTSEYPYSECTNPAQIYKKVTSGKLPDAFYRIQDPEAQRFIGRCLERAPTRSSAKELLLDPFLSSSAADDYHHHHICRLVPPELLLAAAAGEPPRSPRAPPPPRTDLTITGKINPDDDTIILKVQIANKDGTRRNIYFPFHVLEDTAMEVANEMVKELEITDRDPNEIAQVIEHEISVLFSPPEKDQLHEYNYGEEDKSFYCVSSPSSSQSSFYTPELRLLKLLHDDDDYGGESSSCTYSAVNYSSGSVQEHDDDPITTHSPPPTASSRFCPKEEAPELRRRSSGKRPAVRKNKSMVDMRSQVLNRTLVEEINKRLSKTVGAVESIGFRMPWGRKASAGAGASSPAPPPPEKNKEHKWGSR